MALACVQGGRAKPGCGCNYCEAVYDEWGRAAEGFQRWYEALSPATLRYYFGEVRPASEGSGRA